MQTSPSREDDDDDVEKRFITERMESGLLSQTTNEQFFKVCSFLLTIKKINCYCCFDYY